MQGLRDPSFFPTKKPAPTGEDGARIRPAFREVSMYSSIAFVLGPEIENNLSLGRVAPGIRSIGTVIGTVLGERGGLRLAEYFRKVLVAVRDS